MDERSAHRMTKRRRLLAGLVGCAIVLPIVNSVRADQPADRWEAFRSEVDIQDEITDVAAPKIPQRLPPPIRAAQRAAELQDRLTRLYGPERSAEESQLPGAGVTAVLASAANDGRRSQSPSQAEVTEHVHAVPVKKLLPRLSHRTVDTSRLMEDARQSLEAAHRSLKSDAVFTAEKSALDALRSVVNVNDMELDSDWCSQQLEIGLQALREAEDFNGKYGPVDAESLARMVYSHETTVLKDVDLSGVTGIEATEQYLQQARVSLFDAAGGVPEAGQALMLLARAQREEAGATEHNASVALAMQLVAVELLRADAGVWRQLAQTQLDQGLAVDAVRSAGQSLQIEESFEAYDVMRLAAERLGDQGLIQHCLASMQKRTQPQPSMAVRVVPVNQFAATSTRINTPGAQAHPNQQSFAARGQQAARTQYGQPVSPQPVAVSPQTIEARQIAPPAVAPSEPAARTARSWFPFSF